MISNHKMKFFSKRDEIISTPILTVDVISGLRCSSDLNNWAFFD